MSALIRVYAQIGHTLDKLDKPAPLIPETLNVNNDYGPVNGQPLVLYLPSPPLVQGRMETPTNP